MVVPGKFWCLRLSVTGTLFHLENSQHTSVLHLISSEHFLLKISSLPLDTNRSFLEAGLCLACQQRSWVHRSVTVRPEHELRVFEVNPSYFTIQKDLQQSLPRAGRRRVLQQHILSPPYIIESSITQTHRSCLRLVWLAGDMLLCDIDQGSAILARSNKTPLWDNTP